jgi:hypothetical protein
MMLTIVHPAVPERAAGQYATATTRLVAHDRQRALVIASLIARPGVRGPAQQRR